MRRGFSPNTSRVYRPRNVRNSGARAPEVVVEILSHSDSWPALLRKLDIYVSTGARCVIAIDPSTRRVETGGEQPVGLQLDYDAIMNA